MIRWVPFILLLLPASVPAQWLASNQPPVAPTPSLPSGPTLPVTPMAPGPFDPTAPVNLTTNVAPPRRPLAPLTPLLPQDVAGRPFRPAAVPATPVQTNAAPAVLPPAAPATTTNAMPGRVWRVGVGPKSDFPTLQKAADAAQPGDTVVLEPGLYGGFRTMRNGTKNAPITFRGEPGAIIHVNGNSPPDHVAVRHDWIVVTGFTVRHAQRAGISVIEASDVVVSNNVVGPNGVWAIFTGFAPRVRIENNKAFGSAKQHGIYVSNSREPADRPIVRGNECYANAASGIQLNGDCRMEGDGILHEALIENNVLHDNDSKALSLISIEDCLIQNNLIFRNGRRDGAAGIHLTDEPGCGKPSRRNLVVNNTIVESRMAGIRLSDQAQDNILFNNLMVGRGITDEVGLNQIDAASNHVAKEPRDVFAQPENGDYRLRPLLPLPAGASNYAGRTAPKQDLSGMRRDELRPAIGACDTQCEELPLPGKFDAAAEAAWNPASYQTP